MIARIWLLVQIAVRNLLASPINLIIGGLILFGTMFFVVFGALLDSLNQSMARSVIGSVAGHIQIYSSASKDELSLFAGMGGDPDLTAVNEFPQLKATLEALPNVKTVVPMGTSGAVIASGNIVDVTLEKIRDLVRARDGASADQQLNALPRGELDTRLSAEVSHLRQIITVLEADAKKAQVILSADAVDPEALAVLAKVSTEAFWKQFEDKPYDALEFLENRIAPQVSDSQMIFMRYVGTDLDAFQQSFDRMEIIDGQAVPKGQRGFLISKYLYEDQMKLKNARRLDKLRDAKAVGRLIATDDELKRYVKENRSQTRDIVLQLDGLKTAAFAAKLQAFLGSKEPALTNLLTSFFETTDENFTERYDYFYKELVPMLQLYKVRIGTTLTVKAFTKSGSVQSVNVKVYGTFAFKGLEKSPLAGATSLMDIMSFRDLYGYLTTDKKEELAELEKETGAKKVNRESAEAELFGDDSSNVVAEATAGVIDADKNLTGMGRKLRNEDLVKRVYSKDEINAGVVLNAAVMVKDPKKIEETIAAINALSADKQLGIKAVSWQQASGILGQIIGFMRWVLLFAVAFIFLVAIIIINNAMMMATIQRTQMLGTMRAIGAQKSLVLGMVLVETLTLSVLFGSAGIGLGSAVIGALHSKGIAAPNDVAYFFFSGPRLLPEASGSSLVIASFLILIVAVVSTIIPAVIATQVSPLRAMQSDE